MRLVFDLTACLPDPLLLLLLLLLLVIVLIVAAIIGAVVKLLTPLGMADRGHTYRAPHATGDHTQPGHTHNRGTHTTEAHTTRTTGNREHTPLGCSAQPCQRHSLGGAPDLVGHT